MKTSYFLCITDFEIIKQNTWKFSTRVIFLKFTISVSSSHCDCSHWVPKKPNYAIGLMRLSPSHFSNNFSIFESQFVTELTEEKHDSISSSPKLHKF